jgi:hypothetical protein
VQHGATAGLAGRAAAVGGGDEGAAKDGDGHGSTRSALQRRESLPFAASRLQWGGEREEEEEEEEEEEDEEEEGEGVNCGGRERPVWW